MNLMRPLAKVLPLLFSLAAAPVFATTLTYTDYTTTPDGRYLAGPFYNSVDHSSTALPMFCLDIHNDQTIGQTWKVLASALPTDNSVRSIQLREAAVINSYYGFGYTGDPDAVRHLVCLQSRNCRPA